MSITTSRWPFLVVSASVATFLSGFALGYVVAAKVVTARTQNSITSEAMPAPVPDLDERVCETLERIDQKARKLLEGMEKNRRILSGKGGTSDKPSASEGFG
jgi:hypothetical protein